MARLLVIDEQGRALVFAGPGLASPDLEPDHLLDPTGVLLLTRDDDLKWPFPGGKGLAVAVVGQKSDTIGEGWVEKVKQYRLAVDAYCDAVEHSTGDFSKEWQLVELARDEAERARSALLRQRPKPLFARIRSLVLDDVSDHDTEELVLGDLGQHGG